MTLDEETPERSCSLAESNVLLPLPQSESFQERRSGLSWLADVPDV